MFTTNDLEEITSAARKHGIDERAMIALGLTESSGRVYWDVNGEKKPPIRPEVHVFYRELKEKPGVQQKAVELGLAHPKPNGVKLPSSYSGRYEFFHKMLHLDQSAAIAATSFGWGQIMGFNYGMLGYGTPFQIMEEASTLEGQTELVARYIEATGLTPFLNNLPNKASAERVAKAYNGPAWRKNDYANKLIRNWKNAGAGVAEATGRTVVDLQTALKQLGYDPGAIDGMEGVATRAAVRAYQKDNGLTPDGDAGPMTWEELEKDLAELQSKSKRKSKDRIGAVGVGVGGTAVLTELVGEVSALKDTLFGLFEGMAVPDGIIQIVVALVVAYLVYTKFFADRDQWPGY